MPTDSSTSSSELLLQSAGASLRFLARALVALLVSLGVWSTCTFLFLRGETDDAYLKVATPAQVSMIVGTSRAAQGLVPSELGALTPFFDGPIYNFAFTSATSPWGPAYLRAIEMKLATGATQKPRLFLVEVSPLAITTREGEGLREEKRFLGRLHSVTLSPNIEYPLYNPERGFDILERLLLIARGANRQRLHTDGWLEVTLRHPERNFASRLKQKLALYAGSFDVATVSPVRVEHLTKTVELLKARGRVAIVRLPADPVMLALETERMPDFDGRMVRLAQETGAQYFDLTDLSPRVRTTDGGHLARESSRSVSRELAQRMLVAGVAD